MSVLEKSIEYRYRPDGSMFASGMQWFSAPSVVDGMKSAKRGHLVGFLSLAVGSYFKVDKPYAVRLATRHGGPDATLSLPSHTTEIPPLWKGEPGIIQ